MQKSLIELILSRRARERWFIFVGIVGAGGLVGPWGPVAIIPIGNIVSAAAWRVKPAMTRHTAGWRSMLRAPSRCDVIAIRA
jgi:hypothetical protein